MFKRFFKILFLIILLCISIQPQSTYYVSVNGNDNNDGLTPNTSFATLQHAANIVAAGDSVFVSSGNYTGFDIRTSGTSTMPIVFKALDNNVIIDVRNPKTNDGINIEGADWIEINGFNVINQPRAGIRIVLSDFVKIINNTCTSNYRWGIFTGFTNDILIENNSCSYSQMEHGIYVSNSSDRPAIRHNHSFNNKGCGIHMNGDASMGDDGIISDAVVEGNVLHDNGVGGGSAINMDGVQDSKIFNNLLYNNHATGIALFQIDGGDASKNNKVYNNTIVHPSDGRWAILVVNGSTGNTIYNNILINKHTFRGSICIDEESKPGFVSDYNLVVNRLSNDEGNSNMTLSSWQSLGYDIHSQVVQAENFIFIDLVNSNYHLLQSSQPINIGTSLVSPVVYTDLDGVVRPQGNGFDIGCYEYTPSTGIVKDNIIQKDFILFQNYPNPFNPSTNINYKLPIAGYINLKIYDVLGNEIETLVDEYKEEGNYSTSFNSSSGLSSGVYIYKIEIKNNDMLYTMNRKMTLLK